MLFLFSLFLLLLSFPFFTSHDYNTMFYLITVKGDKRVDLKEFRKNNFLRHLSFASEQDLQELLNLNAGSVTPLGLFND